jgi:hypothetical protein
MEEPVEAFGAEGRPDIGADCQSAELSPPCNPTCFTASGMTTRSSWRHGSPRNGKWNAHAAAANPKAARRSSASVE